MLTKAIGRLEAEHIAYRTATSAADLLRLIRSRIEITIGIRVQQQLVHLLAIALAADADLAG